MLREMGTSSTTIFIAWDAVNCTERNSNITGYEVRYGPVNGASLNASISGADNLTYTASGLMVSTNYSFEVAAESSSGTGPFSSSVVARTGEFFFLQLVMCKFVCFDSVDCTESACFTQCKLHTLSSRRLL